MPLSLASLDVDLQRIVGDLPAVVVHGANTYRGRRGILRRKDLLERPGLDETYRESVYLRRSVVVSPAPAIDDLVTVDGQLRRILLAEYDPAGLYVRLDLGEEYAHD